MPSFAEISAAKIELKNGYRRTAAAAPMQRQLPKSKESLKFSVPVTQHDRPRASSSGTAAGPKGILCVRPSSAMPPGSFADRAKTNGASPLAKIAVGLVRLDYRA